MHFSLGTGCASVYTGRVNQYTYQNILENELLPSVELFYHENSPWIFQQDGATANTAHSVRDWLSSQEITVLPWCGVQDHEILIQLRIFGHIWTQSWSNAN